VKTTLEIPDTLFRQAKATAARQGQTLKAFINAALWEKLTSAKGNGADTPPWMKFFGAGKPFAASIHAIDRAVAEEFEQIEAEDQS